MSTIEIERKKERKEKKTKQMTSIEMLSDDTNKFFFVSFGLIWFDLVWFVYLLHIVHT